MNIIEDIKRTHSEEEFKNLFPIAMNILFIAEAALVVGLYLTAKFYISDFWADFGLMAAFIWQLHQNYSLMNPIIKDSIAGKLDNAPEKDKQNEEANTKKEEAAKD